MKVVNQRDDKNKAINQFEINRFFNCVNLVPTQFYPQEFCTGEAEQDSIKYIRGSEYTKQTNHRVAVKYAETQLEKLLITFPNKGNQMKEM